ncbi:MAG: hypothetical protein WDN01_03325 [Rhizomicrobium sp.]
MTVMMDLSWKSAADTADDGAAALKLQTPVGSHPNAGPPLYLRINRN